jgi:hypothetical protein
MPTRAANCPWFDRLRIVAPDAAGLLNSQSCLGCATRFGVRSRKIAGISLGRTKQRAYFHEAWPPCPACEPQAFEACHE